MRSEIGLLLTGVLALLSVGCDRRSAPDGQGGGNGAATGRVLSGEVPPAAGSGSGAPAARIDRSHAGEAAPAIVFTGPDGGKAMLANRTGRPLLVNLWATWCGPCVAELPMLDALAADGAVAVLAVSQDMGDATTVGRFFAGRHLRRLALYRDPENRLSFHFGTGLLPTSVLYDRRGREVARVAGALDWTTGQGRALIDAAARR